MARIPETALITAQNFAKGILETVIRGVHKYLETCEALETSNRYIAELDREH